MSRNLQIPLETQTVPIADRLIAEYHDLLPPGVVLRCVARCRYQLRRDGVRAGLDDAVEAMARHRLRHLHTVRSG